MKPAELARVTGIPAQRFTEWKEAKPEKPRLPTLPQAFKIARALDVPLDYLADDQQDDPPPAALSEEDDRILEIARSLGYEEAKRRLVVADWSFSDLFELGRWMQQSRFENQQDMFEAIRLLRASLNRGEVPSPYGVEEAPDEPPGRKRG